MPAVGVSRGCAPNDGAKLTRCFSTNIFSRVLGLLISHQREFIVAGVLWCSCLFLVRFVSVSAVSVHSSLSLSLERH